VLELSLASGASRVPARPLVHKGLSADEYGLLGPRTKIGRGHHAMCRVLGNVTEGEADVMNLGDLKLVSRCVAADRQYDERGPADTARNGLLKVLQRHGIEVSIVLATANSHGGSVSDTRSRTGAAGS
jgi:hypothetical protein